MSTASTKGGSRHIPVLPAEVLEALIPTPGQVMVDATVGAGGHAELLAQRLAPDGRLIALDRDPAMLEIARERLQGLPVTFVQANFDGLRDVLDELKIELVAGVLADLGICSDQLDTASRGFSFLHTGPLDMRLNPEEGEPASILVNQLNHRELADIFYHYGEEHMSRHIARRIIETREREPFENTQQLAALIRSCVPRSHGKKRAAIDPATRVFQALRIAVNDELGSLDRFLAVLPRCLKPQARVAVISFQSLEDRRVKIAFRDKTVWDALTRKPLQASEEEIRRNPRCRSAKLRVARILSPQLTPQTPAPRTENSGQTEPRV